MSTDPERVLQNVVLHDRHKKGLTWLSQEAGATSASAMVRSLIESAMRDRFGANWLAVIQRDEAEAETESVAVA